MQPYTNVGDMTWQSIMPGRVFRAGTLLMLPPKCQREFIQTKDQEGETTYTPYFTYTVKFIYDPEGWTKKLLNVGNRANFGGTLKSESIYQLTVSDSQGALVQGPIYTNQAGVLNWRNRNRNNIYNIQADVVTQQLPLTNDGFIYQDAIRDPVTYPYLQLSFMEYNSIDFSLLPIRK